MHTGTNHSILPTFKVVQELPQLTQVPLKAPRILVSEVLAKTEESD